MFFDQKSSFSILGSFTKRGHGFANFSVDLLDLLTEQCRYSFLVLLLPFGSNLSVSGSRVCKTACMCPGKTLAVCSGVPIPPWVVQQTLWGIEHTAKNNHVCPRYPTFLSWRDLGWLLTIMVGRWRCALLGVRLISFLYTSSRFAADLFQSLHLAQVNCHENIWSWGQCW